MNIPPELFGKFLKVHTDEELIRLAHRLRRIGDTYLAEILLLELKERESSLSSEVPERL